MTTFNFDMLTLRGREGTTVAPVFASDFSVSDVRRFDENVDAANATGCRLWNGEVAYNFGVTPVGAGTTSAHRAAFALAYGELPAGLAPRQTCGDDLCCTPAHLLLTLPAEKAEPVVRSAAPLTLDEVDECRRLARAGESIAALAAGYEVTRMAMTFAVTGVTGQAATEPPLKAPRRNGKAWTPAEDAVVFGGSVKVIAERLGRSPGSVENRQRVLRKAGVAS